MRSLVAITLVAFGAASLAAGDNPSPEIFQQSQLEFTFKTPSGFEQTASNTGHFPTPMGNVPYEEKAWQSKGDTIFTKVTVMPEAWWQTHAAGAFADAKHEMLTDPRGARVISERDYVVGGCRAHSFVGALGAQFQRIDYFLIKPDLRVVVYLSANHSALSASTCSELFESISIRPKIPRNQ